MSIHAKVPMEEVEAHFARCRAEPSMRSVTAVLRITREQISARGHLAIYPKAAIVSGVLAIALACALPFLPIGLIPRLMPFNIGIAVIAAILSYGALTGIADRRAAAEQERALFRLAAESLEDILAVRFPRKPLEREHVDTLRDLVKAKPELARLQELLFATKKGMI